MLGTANLEKSEAKAEGTKNENAEEKQTESSFKESKTDSKTEMEKMMSFGRNLGLGKI